MLGTALFLVLVIVSVLFSIVITSLGEKRAYPCFFSHFCENRSPF